MICKKRYYLLTCVAICVIPLSRLSFHHFTYTNAFRQLLIECNNLFVTNTRSISCPVLNSGLLNLYRHLFFFYDDFYFNELTRILIFCRIVREDFLGESEALIQIAVICNLLTIAYVSMIRNWPLTISPLRFDL
jgi:hypothetical protein